MRNFILLFSSALMILFCLGCKEGKPTSHQGKVAVENVFLPLINIIKNDIRNAQKTFELNRLITVNGVLDSMMIKDTADIHYIDPLLNLSLTRLELEEQFKVDTIFGIYGDIEKITLEAKDLKNSIQYFFIEYDNGSPSNVVMRYDKQSPIADMVSTIHYRLTKGYKIELIQKSILKDTINIKIENIYSVK